MYVGRHVGYECCLFNMTGWVLLHDSLHESSIICAAFKNSVGMTITD
jgi:hypothetical protein